jgi:D-3-phosphoglycerate dehydrogenase
MSYNVINTNTYLTEEAKTFLEQAGCVVTNIPLDEVLANSDIVSLHCSLTDRTRGLIGGRELALMKNGGYLINTTRAAVVDRAALIEALKNRRIAGAAVDVHDSAPCRSDDELVALDNVLATPFIAYRTEESISRMCIAAAREVAAVLKGQVPQYPVNGI